MPTANNFVFHFQKMKTFLVTLIFGSSMMIVSSRTLQLQLDTLTEPELNTNTTATALTQNSNTTLIKIGTFGGMSYFRDSVLRNWNDSKSFCQSHGSKLAEIKNKDQLKFLRNAVVNVTHQQRKHGSWLSNTGIYERVYETLERINLNCPFLHPDFDYDYLRISCSYKHFSLCQTVDSGESFFIINSSKKEESSEDYDNDRKSYDIMRPTTAHTSVNKTSVNQIRDILIFNGTHRTLTTTSPNLNRTLIEIGTFQGKSYFGDHVLRDWQDSKSFCEDHGLQLAKIDNKDQLQFLRSAVHTVARQRWSWVSNTGYYEVNRNCKKPLNRCPVLAPFGQGYIRRRCRDKHIGLCQTVDSSEEYFTSGSSSEEESTEEIRTTNESVNDNEKKQKSKTDMFFQFLVDGGFQRSTIQAIKIGMPAYIGDYSSWGLFQESESSREVAFT